MAVKVTMPILKRARELRAAGVPLPHIERVIRVDFGESPHHETLRKYMPDQKRKRPLVGAALKSHEAKHG